MVVVQYIYLIFMIIHSMYIQFMLQLNNVKYINIDCNVQTQKLCSGGGMGFGSVFSSFLDMTLLNHAISHVGHGFLQINGLDFQDLQHTTGVKLGVVRLGPWNLCQIVAQAFELCQVVGHVTEEDTSCAQEMPVSTCLWQGHCNDMGTSNIPHINTGELTLWQLGHRGLQNHLEDVHAGTWGSTQGWSHHQHWVDHCQLKLLVCWETWTEERFLH